LLRNEPNDGLAGDEHLPVEVRDAGQDSPAHEPADGVLGELKHFGRLRDGEHHRFTHL
jgi:hypothetical protein